MELPRLAIELFRLLPPALRDDDIDAAVAVDVAVPQAVGEPLGAGDRLALGARAADGDALPGLGRVLAGDEVAHFAAVVGASLLRIGLIDKRVPAHDQELLAGLEQIDVDGG